jgi:prolyl-tRNA synthetase
MAKGITKQSEDFSAWYTEVVQRADLADYSPVRGCMVIKPYGYAIWERLQRRLDDLIKAEGVDNAYFPLFIPESFIHKEAEHVEGFSPELAIVTIGGGKELEEKLVVRPTSETIINSMFAKWVQSWRDLPLLVNQWANIVRWEMRTRLFLRTTEFLWQEGHTCHATEEEADAFALRMLEVYRQFLEEDLAVPLFTGVKSAAQRFAGAKDTYAIEAMMKDRRALQAGTSHNLAQNFAKAFEIQYQTEDNRLEYVWQTSWGVSTRLIGAIVMVHGDDKGLVLPPRIAPHQIVIVPIWKGEDEKSRVIEVANALKDEFSGFRIKIDDREQFTPGWKFNEWEMRGVPLRMELGPKDLEKKQVVLVRRDTGEKKFAAWTELPSLLGPYLEEIQKGCFENARTFKEENTFEVTDYDEFRAIYEGRGGFVWAGWCGDPACEERIQEETKATIRCIPFKPEKGVKCIACGKEDGVKVVFARAY